MPSESVVTIALILISLGLVLVVGTVGMNALAPKAEELRVGIGSVQMVRALGDRYLLVVSVVNLGTVPVTVQAPTLRGEGNPSCSLLHVQGSLSIKPGERVELTLRCSPARLGSEYLVMVGTDRGVQAWAKVTATG